MTTTTEKYIQKAVQEAKKTFGGHVISDCNITMNLEASNATRVLAEALANQARANRVNSEAMLRLAETLKPVDACAIKITNDSAELSNGFSDCEQA